MGKQVNVPVSVPAPVQAAIVTSHGSDTVGKKINLQTHATQAITIINPKGDFSMNKTLTQYLPEEFLTQQRFFPVTIREKDGAKVPMLTGWQKTDNQLTFETAAQKSDLIGFDISGHEQGVDYLLFDFDHVLADNGDFVNDDARKWIELILKRIGGYCERSISGHGIHILAKPTAGKFAPVSAGKQGVLYFDKSANVKLEIFYKTGRYCLMTGNLFRTKDRNIAEGAVVDEVFSEVLAEIQARAKKTAKSAKVDEKPKNAPTVTMLAPTPQPARTPHTQQQHSGFAPYVIDDDPAYKEFRINRMLDAINPSDLEDSDWLAVISACKNEGVPYAVVDAFNQRDPNRYNADENQSRWDSVADMSFNIETLHGIAKRFGYDERESQRDWYQLHPELSARTKYQKSGKHSLSEEQRAALFGNPSRTDRANAKRLAYLFGERIHYLQDRDCWLIYSKGIWTIGANSRNAVILPFVNQAAEILSANATNEAERKIADSFEHSRKAASAITYLRSFDEIIITEKDLDAHPNLLNCLDCVVDLETGERLAADPNLLFTRQANATFRGIDYRDPNNYVEDFLCSIQPDEETLAALIRFLGYALSGEIRQHVALFWRGDGRNGKGTLINLLFALLNTYAVKLPTAALLDSGRPADANQATTSLNGLAGARLAICDELNRRARLNSSLFKTLTGGDILPLRNLNAEFKNVVPTAKLILNGNYLPEIEDPTDFGLRERLRNVPFTETFTGERADPLLHKKLSTPEALSAMLSILVAAARDWHRDGLLESKAMKEAKREYIADNDFITNFIDEFCQRDAKLSIKRKDFLDKLKSEYATECLRMFGNSDNALSEATRRIDGISYRRSTGGANRFFGIGWKGAPAQQSLPELNAKITSHEDDKTEFDVSQFDD